jgi:hypothetical protein
MFEVADSNMLKLASLVTDPTAVDVRVTAYAFALEIAYPLMSTLETALYAAQLLVGSVGAPYALM